jgi:hypothetical protein
MVRLRSFLHFLCCELGTPELAALRFGHNAVFGIHLEVAKMGVFAYPPETVYSFRGDMQKNLGWQTWEAEALLQSHEIGIRVATKSKLTPARFLAIRNLLAQCSPGCYIHDL